VFPSQPGWFRGNLDFGNIAEGLAHAGFSTDEVDRLMGLNWLAFFDRSFGPAASTNARGAAAAAPAEQKH
jgi:membrane dipeptidase